MLHQTFVLLLIQFNFINKNRQEIGIIVLVTQKESFPLAAVNLKCEHEEETTVKDLVQCAFCKQNKLYRARGGDNQILAP